MVLTAATSAFDSGSLLLLVTGKGRRERRVPFSIELRRVLYRFGQFKERGGLQSDLMFSA